MLLREWDYSDPTGWIVQEKFDGIRAIWDGKELRTRQGSPVPCPRWFVEDLPDVPIDGELWIDRESALSGMLSVFGRGASGDWRRVSFVAFDAPSGKSIEQRLADLASMRLPSHCQVAPSRVCAGCADMEDALDDVARRGGEGIVLRKSGSVYEGRRSGNARKLRL